jgi:hypothetical protein
MEAEIAELREEVSHEFINSQSCYAIAHQIANFVNAELRDNCHGSLNRQVVMERVLGHELVFIHFPDYYWRP